MYNLFLKLGEFVYGWKHIVYRGTRKQQPTTIFGRSCDQNYQWFCHRLVQEKHIQWHFYKLFQLSLDTIQSMLGIYFVVSLSATDVIITKISQKVICLGSILAKNSYPLELVDQCVAAFLNKKYKKPVHTVEKRTEMVVLPYLGKLSLEIRNRLRKHVNKHISNCKLLVIFRSQD